MATAALYLLADLYTDDGDDVHAGAAYRELYARYPRSGRSDEARFHAAIIDIANGRVRPAALAFDSLVALHPSSSEGLAARYWAGRAWSTLGDTTKARMRWRAIVAADPLSYYSMVAAGRLKQAPWTPPAAAESSPHVPAIDSAFQRVALLQQVGMDAEARLELDALDSLANGSTDQLIAVAEGFAATGASARAMRLAERLLQRGVRDGRVYRLDFPLLDAEELERAARTQRLDPALVAGLIRQESNFNPRAVSSAGARGLMQVMPAVGQSVAKSLAFPVYAAPLLFDPDANLELGTAHLAAAITLDPDLARALAAYNAGQTRVDRWVKKAGVADPELFTERIPFVETRDYVRLVLRNAAVYRALYGLKKGSSGK